MLDGVNISASGCLDSFSSASSLRSSPHSLHEQLMLSMLVWGHWADGNSTSAFFTFDLSNTDSAVPESETYSFVLL